ncbi:MAG TPA: diacylglycerol kinase family protein [Gaiellaceae bacterium]|nr:diacylglycerol kinase family protein [Gaiellaceae bacterium]
MRVALIVNPFASRVDDDTLAAVERELGGVAAVEILRTEHPLHATELVTDSCRAGAEAVVVFSGDGGFNEALNGLGDDVPIGFLPGGGTSVLSRALGLPPEPVEAARRVADALATGRTRRITVGRANGRRFSFSAGLGIDAAAVRRVNGRGRATDGRRPGDLAFVLAVLRELAAQHGHIDPMLEVQGHGRAASVFVANGAPYTYARRVPLPIAPEAEFELGLDMVAPVRIRRRSLVRTAVELLTGHPRIGKALYAHDVDRIEVVCDRPVPLQVDGEDLGDVEEAVFEAERNAVSVLS